ncbi:hypothetical protein PHYBLDRAFT_148474 [Phycomyces blakesleeanus NRRL 1555(-)]|uniref:Uncharacterized protein n=1 Tax=Phycomyces blakesleeanus (strain ATCC 8743b / DSM 1359 / FGSC 10004 / NBRC 33097 / NRRL 1555) TaxID=763407 RepID=A0A162TXA5_PHYB8|nr:hypothetical protein PHYBLDRAFT_148474 [Phycomyces blakesleeanus NRRL 1555(-)]OAD70563.1 hypothetical protein PHYBLDRAFT_148474 [Phycomyces blakesleeanus NRRL 1555(-)]|eukprot:XP_018288603.1 hypothetical protein PHYBLDRAFT_148474 [Phycomyces blakesleeanus NRRL 1555(-)]
MLHEKLEEYNSAFEKIMEELEEPEMPEDPKSSAPSTTDETPKKTNKAARATTTTTTTTANDNGSNIDSAEQTFIIKKTLLEHSSDFIGGKTTITSENIEAEASKAVEQALSPECYPVLDQLLRPYIQEEQLYEKYDKTQSAYFEANRHIIKSVVDYLCNQAESKLITPGKIRRKVLRYISSQKLKGKKTDDQTAETNRVGCLSQRRVQTRNKRALALETNREYFVKTYGEGLDDFLHADYMSDLETDCEVEDN